MIAVNCGSEVNHQVLLLRWLKYRENIVVLLLEGRGYMLFFIGGEQRVGGSKLSGAVFAKLKCQGVLMLYIRYEPYLTLYTPPPPPSPTPTPRNNPGPQQEL